MRCSPSRLAAGERTAAWWTGESQWAPGPANIASAGAASPLAGKDDHLPSIRELGSCAELRALAWSLQEARQSKLKMMDAAATAHPFFWGAFSLIGGG